MEEQASCHIAARLVQALGLICGARIRIVHGTLQDGMFVT